MENLPEYLDFLNFESKNAKRFIRVCTNVCMSFLLYNYSGGKVTFPKEITAYDIFNFIYSYQILIPIIYYFFTWILFHSILKTIIRILLLTITDLVYSKVINKQLIQDKDDISSSDDHRKVIDQFAMQMSGTRVNWDEMTPIILENDYKEMLGRAANKIADSLDRIIIFIQIWIIYSSQLKLQLNFLHSVNWIITGSFIIGFFLILRKIVKINRTEKTLFFIKESLLKSFHKTN